MELLLKRLHRTNKSTIGELFINGKFECYTLEDFDRDFNRDGDLNDEGEQKVHSKTAIPKGKYNVIINMSNRFKRQLPLLLNVEGFEGIRIHSGNTDLDSEGCILVGRTRSVDFIGESRLAFTKLFDKMLLSHTPITITIE
jgi:hypothetical protein